MKHLIILIFCCIILFSCQKNYILSEQEKAVIEVNKTKLYGKWSFISVSKSGIVATNANLSYADDWLEFRTDGRGTISEGTLIDNPPIFTPSEFDWKFKDTANIDFGPDEITLQKLNDTSLVFITIRDKSGTVHDEWHWKR